MSDMLKITQPLVSNDSAAKYRPNTSPDQQPPVVHVTDPTRVTKTHDQNVFADRQAQQQAKPNLASNFDFFLQLMRATPSLGESFQELVFSKLTTIVNSGISQDFAAEISQFMELLKMDEPMLLNFVKTQSQTASKFTGPVFTVLQQVLAQNPPEDVKTAVLEFLRAFDNNSASKATLNNIISNLNNIVKHLPPSQRPVLTEMLAKLTTAPYQGSSPSNLNLLKTEIFPFLSKYIGFTKDFGPVRDVITQLTLNLVKYENGTSDKLLNAFQKMRSYPLVFEALAKFPSSEIEGMLLNLKFQQADTQLIDAFVKVLRRGLSGETDSSAKEVFENILKSVLINKSVYMPVQHIMIPANFDGRLFFSEIWVDPDADPHGRENGDGPASKFLIKFDIQGIGFFEIVLLYRNQKVDMLLLYPPALEGKTKAMYQTIEQIMKNNGFTFETFSMEKSRGPLPISDVFPQLYNRKDTINVKV